MKVNVPVSLRSNQGVQVDVAEHGLHRFLEVSDRLQHDAIGRQPRCGDPSKEMPDESLKVVLDGPIRVDQATHRVPVENIGLRFNPRVLEGGFVAIGGTKVEALLELVLGLRMRTMKLECYIVALRDRSRLRAPVVSLQLVAHPEELIHLEPSLEGVEEGGLAAAIWTEKDNESGLCREVCKREIDEAFEVPDPC